jgi:uncharacterized Ntn-hydrolase superfamily protein
MADGESATHALQALLDDDPGREQRQAGFVDASGGAATFTGSECQPWAGGWTGDGVAIQGNILAGPQVVEAMAQAFTTSRTDLGHRLLEALLAGDRAGGDRRGRQSAALLVVRQGGGYAGNNDRWIDYRVDDHADPVPRLAELLELHELYFGSSPPEDRLQLTGPILGDLLQLARRLGHYDGPDQRQWTAEAREGLRRFIGNENFEDRTDFDAGWIDRPAYEFLMHRFAP